MPQYPPAADEHYTRQEALAAAAQATARKAWSSVDVDAISESWAQIRKQLTVTVAITQIAAATDAEPYLEKVSAQLGEPAQPQAVVRPVAFGGWAGDGRPLDSLLELPPIIAKEHIEDGQDPAQALVSAGASLDAMVATAVADAGRLAVSAAMVARPSIPGYVRMLSLPSCRRCVPLAGNWYKWNQGFKRHPRCDCRHVPVSPGQGRGLTLNPDEAIRQGKVTGLSTAERQAITDGADVNQVLNATRGLVTAQRFGRKLTLTTEGTTKRGYAGRRLGAASRRTVTRLTPESIYRIAEDRADAIRLLRQYAYLT